jgi:hypothetical protein
MESWSKSILRCNAGERKVDVVADILLFSTSSHYKIRAFMRDGIFKLALTRFGLAPMGGGETV